MNISDFMNFRTMITPKLIVAAYAILTTLSVIGSLGFVALLTLGGLTAEGDGSLFAAIITDLVVVVFGCGVVPLFLRLWCETVILFFRVNDSLTEIAHNTK